MDNFYYTWDPAKHRDVYVGVLIGDAFVRQIKPERHCMRVMGHSYALQKDVLKRLQETTCRFVVLEAPKYYLVTPLEDWFASNIRQVDMGHGVQHFVPQHSMQFFPKTWSGLEDFLLQGLRTLRRGSGLLDNVIEGTANVSLEITATPIASGGVDVPNQESTGRGG